MIQYNETTFSDVMELDSAIAEVVSRINQSKPTYALHIGEKSELYRRKQLLLESQQLQTQIDSIKEELKSLNARPISKILYVPTDEEVKTLTVK